MDGQGTKRRRKIAESFNRLSRAHHRYRRQRDRGTGDSIYSEQFTFAKSGMFWKIPMYKMCQSCVRVQSDVTDKTTISECARDFYQLFGSLRRTGMVFLGTEVPVWFIPVQGSAGMAYRLIPSHLVKILSRYWNKIKAVHAVLRKTYC